MDYDYYRSLVHRLDDSGMPMVYKKNPVYVVLRNSSYYFVCMDEEEGVLEHFRVDRMLDVSVIYDEEMDKSLKIRFLNIVDRNQDCLKIFGRIHI